MTHASSLFPEGDLPGERDLDLVPPPGERDLDLVPPPGERDLDLVPPPDLMLPPGERDLDLLRCGMFTSEVSYSGLRSPTKKGVSIIRCSHRRTPLRKLPLGEQFRDEHHHRVGGKGGVRMALNEGVSESCQKHSRTERMVRCFGFIEPCHGANRPP